MDVRRADTIANALEEMIFTGDFADGARLDEQRLSDHFGVSRTPLREALQKLSVAGLVEQIPRRGVFVRHPGPVELIEMFEVMAEMEASCGRLAATRMTTDDLTELRQANAACAQAVTAEDVNTYYNENERFHKTIYRGANNSFLLSETLRLQRRLQPYRRKQLLLRGRMKQSLSEHATVVDALSAGDSDAAANTLRGHVAVQGEKFHHLIASLSPKKNSAKV